jgi:inner membrane protein
MASLGHIAVGLAAGRRFAAQEAPPRLAWTMLYFAALAMLPDLDTLGLHHGIPYANPFGHRGAAHSLCAAAIAGTLSGALARFPGVSRARTIAWSILVLASHGLLDTLTDGGLGVALFWPLTHARYFAPWRPIPVAPIGRALLSLRGLRVLLIELVFSLPLLAYALWPRRSQSR